MASPSPSPSHSTKLMASPSPSPSTGLGLGLGLGFGLGLGLVPILGAGYTYMYRHRSVFQMLWGFCYMLINRDILYQITSIFHEEFNSGTWFCDTSFIMAQIDR